MIYTTARPRGLVPWTPYAKNRALLVQVEAVLAEYVAYLPLTIRQVFYRLVGAHGYEKDDRAYGRLGEMMVRARRAELIPFDAIRDDGRESGYSRPSFDLYVNRRPPSRDAALGLAGALEARAERLRDYAARLREAADDPAGDSPARPGR